MKTLRILLLTCICLLGSIGISAQNVDFDFKVDGLYYKILSMSDKTVNLVYEDRTHTGDFSIPASVDFKGIAFQVVYVGDYAFSSNEGLTTVRFPESITSIGKHVFAGCQNLTDIVFTDSLKKFGTGAFSGCGMTTINLPKYIREVSDWAFCGCLNLKQVVIPDSVRILDDCAFQGCKALESIQLPDHLEILGTNAFDNCHHLKEMHFPKSLKRIEGGTFQSCYDLATVVFPDSMEYIGYSTFHSCKSLTDVVLPASLPQIDDNIFYYCSGLQSVTLPKDLTCLSRQFFYQCTSLQSVTLPECLQSIGEGAFKGCSGLIAIEIPRKVSTIGDEAFWECSNLRSIKSFASNPPYAYTRTFDLLNYANATLYVPKGVGEAYRNREIWSNFSNVVEMAEAPVETYPLYVSVGKGGSVVYERYYISNQHVNLDVPKGQTVVLNVKADAGYRIKSVRWNNEDVMSKLVDSSFRVVMDAYGVLEVDFEKLPVDLVIRQADNGCTLLRNADGKSFTLKFEAAEGWRLNTVTFNGRDVTYSLNEQNEYVTPVIQLTSELNVSFEMDGLTDVAEVEGNPVSVSGYQGEIVISGAPQGERIAVYTVDGANVAAAEARGNAMKIKLTEHRVYVVKVGNRTFKLAL